MASKIADTLEAAREVVLTANITLGRGGIWNLAFKDDGKISKFTEKSENTLG